MWIFILKFKKSYFQRVIEITKETNDWRASTLIDAVTFNLFWRPQDNKGGYNNR